LDQLKNENMQEGLYDYLCSVFTRAGLNKQFFQTFFAEAPLTAYLYAGDFTLANQAVQGSFLNL